MNPRRTRRAVSLIEVLVCVGIIALMMSMMFPAIQKVRIMAVMSQCQNNLRQLGLAVQNYSDTKGHLPYPRYCPTPWKGGKDPLCLQIANTAEYTGPNELWWCPYDNRPGAAPTHATAGYEPGVFLLPFVGNITKVFICPDGYDRTNDSPTKGELFQIGYALNPEMGGRNSAEYVGVTIFEHDDVPYCFSPSAHFTTWPTTAVVKSERHSPQRHQGTFSIARHDGSVSVHR